jgi:hypothetical protein
MDIYFRLSYNLCEKKFLIPQNHDMGDFAFFTNFCYHEKSTKFSYGAEII